MLSSWPRFRDESALAILVGVGAVVYGGLVVALLGRRWLSLLRGTAPLHATPSLTSGVDQA